MEKRYAKPEGFKGRGNVKTYKKYKWSITMYDKETGEMRSGKFCSKEQMIQEMNLNISLDHIYRIYSGCKVDINRTKKDSSFLSKYGNIKIEKINENIN